MTHTLPIHVPHDRWPLYGARFLVLAWALFWTWFGLASGIGEGLPLEGILVHTALPGLVFLTLAVLAWWKHHLGAYLLTFTGVAILFIYPSMARNFPASTIVLVILTLAAPAIVSGLMFWREARRDQAPR
jgi:MFS superfamily sulfate permease-like transporter